MLVPIIVARKLYSRCHGVSQGSTSEADAGRDVDWLTVAHPATSEADAGRNVDGATVAHPALTTQQRPGGHQAQAE